jgi:hypothetical protein
MAPVILPLLLIPAMALFFSSILGMQMPKIIRSGMTACLALLLSPLLSQSQKTVIVDSTEPDYRTVIPGQEYKKGGFYQFLWGRHYRKEWTTPVRIPVIRLDTVAGGLTPLSQGGGRQTRTLRLADKAGKQYVLRSIDKDYSRALPEITKGTVVEDLARDQVSTGHPFASITVPGMVEAAGVFHTNPRIVFVPYSPLLGKFNEDFANTLCLFEERPDESQEDAPHFGNAEDIKGTERMLQKIFKNNDNRVDQRAYVRARLFDMFLGDWSRREDQWRWAEFDSAGVEIYKPVPRDRDQVYTRFDGFLVTQLLSIERFEYLRTFS